MVKRISNALLIGLVGPFILLAFQLIFREGSYQYWGDKYHSVLSSQYLFSRVSDGSVLGPLWREDLMAGSPWLVSLGTVPFMLDTMLARALHLSPFGIDLVGNVIGYAVAAGAMYLYLRRALSLTVEGAVVGAVLFAANGYLLAAWTGCANDLVTTGLLPALLVLCHRVSEGDDSGKGGLPVLPWVGLALLTFAAAAASSPKTLPIMLFLVAGYVVCVFRSGRSVLLAASAMLVGLVLYSPWLSLFWDAVSTSQRSSDAFVPAAAFDPVALTAAVLVVVRRQASGFSVYGMTMPALLVVVVSAVAYQDALKRALPSVRPIIAFSLLAFVLCFGMDAFSAQVNDLKRRVPIVGGYDVVRFEWFVAFFWLVPVAWMLDRGIASPRGATDSPARARSARAAVVLVGALGFAQAAHIARRTLDLSGLPAAQTLVLDAFLALFLFAWGAILILGYRGLGGWSEPRRRVWLALVAICVDLQSSLLGYRQGVESASRAVGDEPIMTYAERFAVPADLELLVQAGGVDHRVVDLTRPYDRVLTTAASTALPLAGLRTPVGYLNLFPRHYDRFIAGAVNGLNGPPSRWVEIRRTSATNLAALQLLDVGYIIAVDGTDLPGYAPWLRHDQTGRVIYRAGSPVGPAFLSPGWLCAASDAEALARIHASDYQTMIARAVLVSGDVGVESLCRDAGKDMPAADLPLVPIGVERGSDRVTVKVEARTSGILTLADVYYPGWRAFVDGAETPIVRTYTALRGVSLSPGRHTVEFVFAPPRFWGLFWLSNGLLVVLLGAAAWCSRPLLHADPGEPDGRGAWRLSHRLEKGTRS